VTVIKTSAVPKDNHHSWEKEKKRKDMQAISETKTTPDRSQKEKQRKNKRRKEKKHSEFGDEDKEDTGSGTVENATTGIRLNKR